MTRALYFELYEGGSKTTNTFEVYEDNSRDAVKNSYYYDSATYNSSKLSGTNGFSAFTPTSSPSIGMLFRIRILYNGSLRFCSAWFEASDNGYADYLPFFGPNGPSNGHYHIIVASDNLLTSKKLSGVTTLDKDLPIKKTIPCNIYVFWDGGAGLSGAAKYPPIVGAATVNIGSTYSMYLPSSTSLQAVELNDINYVFSSHKPTSYQQSFINNYGLESDGYSFFIKGSTKSIKLKFTPQKNVICTGQMAEAISPYAKEFANNGAMNGTTCLPVSVVVSNGFFCIDSGATVSILARFGSVVKRYSVIINTVFMTNDPVSGVYYEFSGDSTSFKTKPVSISSGKTGTVATWLAYIYNLLGANYISADLNKSVTVSIGGHITTWTQWYYAVIAGDGTIIKNSTLLHNNLNFTTTMRKLDGASVFFSKIKLTTIPKLSKKEKASDYNTIITQNIKARVLGTEIIKQG